MGSFGSSGIGRVSIGRGGIGSGSIGRGRIGKGDAGRRAFWVWRELPAVKAALLGVTDVAGMDTDRAMTVVGTHIPAQKGGKVAPFMAAVLGMRRPLRLALICKNAAQMRMAS